MVPTPLQIVLMVTAIAQAVSDVCRLAMTPAGQKLIEQSISDRQKWDEFWMPVGSWFKQLFTGELFKGEKNP